MNRPLDAEGVRSLRVSFKGLGDLRGFLIALVEEEAMAQFQALA